MDGRFGRPRKPGGAGPALAAAVQRRDALMARLADITTAGTGYPYDPDFNQEVMAEIGYRRFDRSGVRDGTLFAIDDHAVVSLAYRWFGANLINPVPWHRRCATRSKKRCRKRLRICGCAPWCPGCANPAAALAPCREDAMVPTAARTVATLRPRRRCLGAGCLNGARPALRGGRPAMAVPTSPTESPKSRKAVHLFG